MQILLLINTSIVHGKYVVINPSKNKYCFKYSSAVHRKKEMKMFDSMDLNIVGQLAQHGKNYEVVWNATRLQKHPSIIDEQTALLGHKRYKEMKETNAQVRWDHLKTCSKLELANLDFQDAECLEEDYAEEANNNEFDNDILAAIENMDNINWNTDDPVMQKPFRKYNRPTFVNNPEMFSNGTALQAFLRYMPLSFWKQVKISYVLFIYF